MGLPRDHSAAVTVGLVRAARVFSNVVSPPLLFAVLGLVVALSELPLAPALAWAAVYGFFVSLAPILVVVYLLRTGRIGDLHMTLPQERTLPYLVSVVCSLVVLALLYALDGPAQLRCLTLLNTVTLVVLALVNTVWLISIHAAAVMGTAAVGGLLIGPLAVALVAPLVVLVCLARLFLKRHTPAQVAAGLALGAGTAVGLRILGCF